MDSVRWSAGSLEEASESRCRGTCGWRFLSCSVCSPCTEPEFRQASRGGNAKIRSRRLRGIAKGARKSAEPRQSAAKRSRRRCCRRPSFRAALRGMPRPFGSRLAESSESPGSRSPERNARNPFLADDQRSGSKENAGLVEASGTPALATSAVPQIAWRAGCSGGICPIETLM